MTALSFTLLYVFILILPGLAITTKCRMDADKFLSVLGISYALFSLLFVILNHYAMSASTFLWLYGLVIVLSAISILTDKGFSMAEWWQKNPHTNPVSSIIFLSLFYQLFAGSYTEIPSDIYAHLERLQTHLHNIRDNTLGAPLGWPQLLKQQGGVFYYLMAISTSLSGASIDTVIAIVDFANRTLFLLAVYFFSAYIFAYQNNSRAVALAAVFFVALHMGINVFAYVRHYSLAPTMLNMVIYFAAVSCFLTCIQKPTRRSFSQAAILIPLLTIAAAAIHVQEATFIIAIISLIAIIGSFAKFLPTWSQRGIETPLGLNACLLISAISITSFVAIYTYAHLNLPIAPNAHWRLWEFGEGVGLIPDIRTLNLKNQFIQVLTLWGLFVYFLFFINLKRYRNNLFLLAGMLSPIFILLNPFFVDLFLRLYNSTTLWRYCFIIPVHFVAADLMVHYFNQFKTAGWGIKKMESSIVIVGLIGLLLPIANTWNSAHYSRMPSLVKVPAENSYVHLKDMLGFLNGLPNSKLVITDPYTGYLVAAMTHHKSERRKFFRNSKFKHFSFKDYSDNPLDDYQKHLLIVNQRTNARSEIGALSDHWAEYELKNIRFYYPEALIDHLNARPAKFVKLWDGGDVKIYEIQ
ncbi:MAG: hypothetical protein HKN50_02885 [Gammaproteobacteria bacterium]|nr:hypothetical protein [Gammaproteobacteria bacterium]